MYRVSAIVEWEQVSFLEQEKWKNWNENYL